MKILVEGKVYDSTKLPILIQFHENEKDMFDMQKYVSAPDTSTKEERQRLIEIDLDHVKVLQKDSDKQITIKSVERKLAHLENKIEDKDGTGKTDRERYLYFRGVLTGLKMY